MLSLAIVVAPLAANGGNITIPHIFANGEVADAEHVNENFDLLVIEANEHEARMSALETQLAVLETTLTNNSTQLANLEAVVTNNSTVLAKHGLQLDALNLSVENLPATIRDYVNENCYLYFGWRDACDGCTAPPTKWGRTSDSNCTNGAGAGNSCTHAVLNGANVQLFGLDPDGDVDTTDKFYIGIKCF